MIEKRLFSKDDDQGITRTFHFDDETNQATIQTQQDVTSIIEENKQEYAQVDERARWGEWSKVASIPMSIYFQLKAEGKLDDQEYMKKWLNDSDNQYFRTRSGKL
jgi:hypothetical protein